MTNYGKENSQIFFILYELFIMAKSNNIKYVNLGACSKNGGEIILDTKYKMKHDCGCESILKYSFSYIKDRDKIYSNRLILQKMGRDEQYLIAHLWNKNDYACNMFFFKENEINYKKQLEWFNTNRVNPNTIHFSIFIKSNNIFIGYCGIKNITTSECELFIVILDSDYYKLGLGKEAFNRLLIYTIELLNGYDIYLNVKPNNHRAIKMYESLNFENVTNDDNDILKFYYKKSNNGF